ncbi:FecR family protein [Methylovulum miyakonense]|uniref:FecR family protein n=1 Tax=Methylovulum miyakonense TaxID=645578 RepID=UPI000399A9BA|nr:FecR family protein [Methylovulum miyakonense]
MTKLTDLQASQNASQQASEWFVLMNSGQASAQQRQEFIQWLAQSPSHQKAWLQTQNLWQSFEQLDAADFPLPKAAIKAHFFSPVRYAFAVSALLLVAVLYRQPFWYADFYTATGEAKTITLSDGSHVELATDSAVSIDYSKSHRRLILHHGEAFFTVAADAARPFDVIAGDTETRALGTAFDVNRDGDDVQVTVYEHSVRVSAGGQGIDKLLTSKTVRYQNQQFSAVTTANLAIADSWRRHHLVFEDQPLADVVKALNRYRRLPIVIFDGSLKNLAVTGLFETDNTDTALQTIEETLAVKVRRLPGGLVVLSGV